MEYCIFPMQNIKITQRYTTSHCAWDIAGIDSGIEEWYAPCTVKVLNILTGNSGSNTVLFGTCNSSGNPSPVMCEDGIARILTFSCTHMDDINNYNLAIGVIYPAGTPCYKEGTKGLSSGNHVHMEVANGWQTNKRTQNNQYLIENYINPASIFFQLSGFNTVINGNGYTFQTVYSRTAPNSNTVTGYLLKTTNLQVAIRNGTVGASILDIIPAGSSGAILEFLEGFQSDGYQWARVKYGATTGYCQLDTYNAYTIEGSGSALSINPLYIVNNSSSRSPAIRSSIRGTRIANVPANTPLQVTDIISGFQSDGYQWVKVNYNGQPGYVQLDLQNWLYLKLN